MMEVMEGCCLLAFSPWLAWSAFLQNPGPPAQGWHHPQWVGPTLINNSVRKGLRAGYYGCIFSIEFPFFQVTLACVKLTQVQEDTSFKVENLKGNFLLGGDFPACGFYQGVYCSRTTSWPSSCRVTSQLLVKMCFLLHVLNTQHDSR